MFITITISLYFYKYEVMVSHLQWKWMGQFLEDFKA